MSEPNRRTILKGAGTLVMVATMPPMAQARAPSVLIFYNDDWGGEIIARATKGFIQTWPAVDVDIVSDCEAMLSAIERKKYALAMFNPSYLNTPLVDWKRRARQRDPDLPIVFHSHFCREDLPRAASEGFATEFLQQPFGIRQLKPVVNRYLSR
ncbi:MAG: hypothetical protein P1V21_11470 [Rhizobiaceae bacterium]|nr:hypothetical protein [Rhizobiaceae bacterium]